MSDKEEIKACMNCGSTNIIPSTWSVFAGAEVGAVNPSYSYKECGHLGTPITFDSDKERLKFIKLKNKDGSK